jgi:hypothetical protein
VAAFRRFTQELQIENGDALELYPEQFEILEPFFAGVTETLILLPKKNGKSTLIAALCLYHLLTEPFADCIVVASSREQAQIILSQAKMFVRQAPGLRKRVTVKEREITYSGGRVRVLASDQDTVDGQLPTLAIVDELHRQRSGELRGVLRLGLGPRNGRMLVISTAGADTVSPLGRLRQKAQMMQNYRRDTETRRSYASAPSFAFFEWSLNPDDDPDDLATVKLVNPAPWKTLETLADDKGAVSEYEWLRLCCNIWTDGEEPWLAPKVWNGLPRAAEIEDGAKVSVGIRVGMGHQSAAVVWVQKVDDVYQVGYELLSDEDGMLASVEDVVRDVNRRFSVTHNAYVSKTFDRSAETLSEEGLVMVPYPVGTRTMDMAETLLKVIGEKRLAHEGAGPFSQQVMAGQVKMQPSGWKFVDRPVGGTPIDALLALAAAVHVAETQQPQEVFFAWS